MNPNEVPKPQSLEEAEQHPEIGAFNEIIAQLTPKEWEQVGALTTYDEAQNNDLRMRAMEMATKLNDLLNSIKATDEISESELRELEAKRMRIVAKIGILTPNGIRRG